MSKDPVEYRNRTHKSHTSFPKFLVKGISKTSDKNIFTSLDEHKLPFDTREISDIFCGKHVMFFVTHHDIYSLYISDTNSPAKNIGRYNEQYRYHEYACDKLSLPEDIRNVPFLCVKKIVSGDAHTVILMENNKILVFGDNTDGQLGENSHVEDVVEPKLVNMVWFDSPIIDITCCRKHTILLSMNGTVYVAGLYVASRHGIYRTISVSFGFNKMNLLFTSKKKNCAHCSGKQGTTFDG